MKNRVKYLIILIAVMIVIIMAGTFAWLTYRSNKTAMVLTIGDINDAMVTLQPYQINRSISPNTTFVENKSAVVNVEANNNTTVPKKVRLYYKVNDIDQDDFRYKITRKAEPSGSYTDYKTGDFSGAVNGQDYEILVDEVPESLTYDYKVYVWLCGLEGENTQGSAFNAELRAEINTNYMKADRGESGDDVFDTGILRSSIEKVVFQNTIPSNIPNEYTPTDVSVSGNNSVIAYFKDDDNNSKYELYIAANGQIVASDLQAFFNYYSNLVRIENANYLDTSQVTSMRATFQMCTKLAYLDVSTWDTSNVTDMSGMFLYCLALTTLDVSHFNTAKVTSMQAMFAGCVNLTTLDVSSFNTSNVTNMQQMFSGVSNAKMNLQTITGINNFNTSNVTNMSAMFQWCYHLTSLNLSGWDVSKVTTMYGMFYNCSALISLNLSGWNTKNVTTMLAMFQECSSLTSLNLSSFNTSNVLYMNSMFSGCSSLASLDISGFNTSRVQNMAEMFNGCSSLTTLNLSSFNTANVTSMSLMFQNCSALTSLDLSSFNTSSVTTMESMFKNDSNLSAIYVSDRWNVAGVTTSTTMFSGCTSLPNFSSSAVDKTNAHYGTGGYLTYQVYNG